MIFKFLPSSEKYVQSIPLNTKYVPSLIYLILKHYIAW